MQSGPCWNGWKSETGAESYPVPSPWVALEARDDLLLMRKPITEPARYYDDLDGERVIIVRPRLLLCEERRYLWHELVHADRRDRACHGNHGVEQSVEREAAARAMPRSTLAWATPQVEHWSDLADLLKLPEEWVLYRWRTLIPADRDELIRAHPLMSRAAASPPTTAA